MRFQCFAISLLVATACQCGVKTVESSGGITLVQPAGPASETTRSIDFGTVRVSQVVSQAIELRNDSRGSWSVTQFALANSSSGDFFLKLPSGPLPVLAPGQTYEAQLRYQPSQSIAETATVNIVTNDPVTPGYVIKVTGNGGASHIDVCSTDGMGNQVCAQEQPNGMLTINLGEVAPPGKLTKPLVVKSLGTLPLNLMSVETTSATSLDYALQLGSLPVSIPPQQSESYSVTFTPSLGGPENGVVEFDSDDPVTPRLLVYLVAIGDAPRLCVTPTSVQFGSVDIGTTATQTIQLTSCGAELVTVRALQVVDDGSGSATATPALFTDMPPSLPQTLAVGSSISVSFTFSPVAFGNASGKASVTTADGETGLLLLQGVGVGCSLSAQPSPVSFGQVPMGGHESETVNISDTGTGSCIISSLAIQGGSSSPFSITAGPLTPLTLTPGQIQQVTVSFSPTTTSAASDALVVTANTSRPVSVPLTGTGITPPPCDLVPDPASIVFASVMAGQTAKQTVTLTNEGTSPCYITGVNLNAVNGGSTAAFTATLTGTSVMGPMNFVPVEVDPAMTAQVVVAFAPTSATQDSADLQIDYNTMPIPEVPPYFNSPYHIHIPVSGGETPPKICVNPTSLDFGSVPAGSMKTMSFSITSCGSGTLWLRGMVMGTGTSPRFSIASQVTLPQYVPAGTSIQVSVQYAPTSTTGDFGDINVLSNDPMTPSARVSLEGNATTVCSNQLSCSVSSLVFPTLQIGRSASLALTCLNVGTQPVTVTGVTFSGPSASEFSSPALPMAQTAAPGGSVRISITYTPQQAGTDTATVAVTSNACNTPSVSLSGAGQVPNYPACPMPQVFSPVVKWNWTGTGAVQPDVNNVSMSPVVVNLTDDNGDGRIDVNDIPDVVFTACSLSNCCLGCLNVSAFDMADFSGIGMMRAVHGKDGSDLFDVTDPNLQLPEDTQIATADLDGDNLPEIIAVQHTFHQGSGTAGLAGKYIAGNLMVFDHTGNLEFLTDQWTGDPNSFEFASAPAVADLDGDGEPEIVFERSVFRHDGTKWYDMSESGNWGHGAFPTISDVNGDGLPDIVSGNLVYSGSGTLLWTAPDGLSAGPTMVIDINGDGKPEVILRDGSQSVHVLDGATGAVIAAASWPAPGANSNDPTETSNGICPAAMSAADLDGDGSPELIIPAGDFIYTWKYTGSMNLTLLWKQPISDYIGQCGASGSAAFDFEGQGKYDVVYHDTQYLYVFRGSDGTVIFQTPRSSDTIFETPVIADVDNDGHVDILMTNDGGGGTITGTLAGVVALSNTGNTWPASRRIWSDHAYHVSEITEDDDVPVVESWSWLPGNNNNWRAQEPLCQP